MSVKKVELECVKTHIRFNGNIGLGLIQRGEFFSEKCTVNWKGRFPTKVHVVKCGKSSYELVEVETNLEFKIRYVTKGVYKIMGKENERVRFFKPINVPSAVIEIATKCNIARTVEPKSTTKKKVTVGKLEKVDNTSLVLKKETSLEEYDKITKLLIDFAEKIDKDFNLMSVCDVNARKYAEDYIRRDLKNQKFDIEGAVAEFDQFLNTEVKQSLKPEAGEKKVSDSEKTKKHKTTEKKKSIKITKKEYTRLFEGGRSGPKVKEIREHLKELGISDITSKTTKSAMRVIAEKYVI